MFACTTKSAFDANLKANASSKNPNVTFTAFNHPPDFGNEFNQPGKAANKPNGSAKPIEKPSIPRNGASISPVAPALKSSGPIKPLVHEKETKVNVNAIKKIPRYPPLSLCASILFTNDDGNTISNAPKNEKAKTINNTKKNKLK